jgi:hypothetical protein
MPTGRIVSKARALHCGLCCFCPHQSSHTHRAPSQWKQVPKSSHPDGPMLMRGHRRGSRGRALVPTIRLAQAANWVPALAGNVLWWDRSLVGTENCWTRTLSASFPAKARTQASTSGLSLLVHRAPAKACPRLGAANAWGPSGWVVAAEPWLGFPSTSRRILQHRFFNDLGLNRRACSRSLLLMISAGGAIEVQARLYRCPRLPQVSNQQGLG